MRTLPNVGRRFLALAQHLYVGNDPAQEADMLTRSPSRRSTRFAPTTTGGPGRQRLSRGPGRIGQPRGGTAQAASRSNTWSKEDEGHGFLNPDNQIDMYHAVERFLAEHLGGRV